MEKNEYEQTLEKIRLFAQSHVSEKRYNHSVRVAETAEKMCAVYGVDEKKGYLAGLAHDICKKYEDEDLIEVAAKDGMPITDVERNKPSLLHGRAAAVVIQSEFNVHDEDIIQAIAFHTLGASNLCPLAKIIYAADKIEPGRPQSSEEYRRNLLSKSLDEMTIAVVEENMDYLKKKGKNIAPASLEFWESLRKQIERNSSM